MPLPHRTAKPFQVVREFEGAVAQYTGAPFCVAVSSCTMALRLAIDWHTPSLGQLAWIEIPKRTYVSVPAQIVRAGYKVRFRDETWTGKYRLNPLPVWDSARWFTKGLFELCMKENEGKYQFVCVSFHATKTLGIEQGGAILHNDPEAHHFLKAARHDGRIEGQPINNDTVKMIGHHCYMSPSVAAQGLLKLSGLPLHNRPLPMSDYPDLSTFEIFK